MVAKVAGGIIGLGLIGTGGVVFVKPEWFGINKEVPWTPLSKDHSFSTTGASAYGTNTFGGKYKGVLTGIVGTNGESRAKNTNEGWWKKAFEQLKTDSKEGKVSDKFKHDSVNENNNKVSTWISDSQGKGLNQICDAAYKKEPNKITENGSDNDEYKEADVWKYCSPIGSKPKTIKETTPAPTYTTGTIGGTEDNKDKLVSTTGNDKFWEIREKEFRGIGKYQKIEETKDAFFDPEKNKKIKDLCEDAYKQTAIASSSAQAPSLTQAIKYCSINKE